MTEECASAVGQLPEEHMLAWSALESECAALKLPAHIENMLGRIRMKIDAAGVDDDVLGLKVDGLKALESKIQETIVRLCSPEESDIPSSLPHDEFAIWVRNARRKHPIEIFTTNYDVLIERSLELARVPLFDGFVGSYSPYFSPDSFENDVSMPRYEWARLWKLHGSVNWKMRGDTVVCSTQKTVGEMILPSNRKYDESRKQPYLALIDRFARSMAREGALLVTCGYSWSDQHINAVILAALDSHPANHAIALVYPELDELGHLCGLAEKYDNLVVVGSKEGILKRERARWALPQQVNDAVASFLENAFQRDDVSEDALGPVSGKMRLGDFNYFCKFVSAMNSEIART